MKAYSGDNVKAIDAYTINEIGITEDALIERASLCIFDAIYKEGASYLIVSGSGNNGADGVALGRMLALKGCRVRIYVIKSEHKSKGLEGQLGITDKLIKTGSYDIAYTDEITEGYDYVVDGIFGVGLSRNLDDKYIDLINHINSLKDKGSSLVSVDIPSGINASDGSLMPVCIHADITVTIGYAKIGILTTPGNYYCGVIYVGDIGLIDDGTKSYVTYGTPDVSIIKRDDNSNKYSYGNALVVAGIGEYYGATYMAAASALKTGCGLVKVYTASSNISDLRMNLPEAIICDSDDELNTDKINAILIGPGLGTSDKAKTLIDRILDGNGPLVIDADGLNILSKNKNLYDKCLYYAKNKGDVIITPHTGELSRLTGIDSKEIQDNYYKTVTDYAYETGFIVVGKGHNSIVAGDKTYINMSGNAGLAKAGSGDVLSGIIVGLIAMGYKAYDAACLGVYMHGLSADILLSKTDINSIMARDVIDTIPECYKKIKEGC